MGCCFSRSRGPNSPYPGAAQSGSSRAINAPANPNQPARSPEARPADPHRSRRRRRRPLDQHVNKRLYRKTWVSQNRTWSRRALDREREDFFDTRVSGRQEVWQSLRAALQVLWESDVAALVASEMRGGGGPPPPPPVVVVAHGGGLDDDDEDDDIVISDEHDPANAMRTAQSILDAAEITLPTGDMADGAYDALGNYYQLPQHIVSDPINLAPDDQAGETKDDLREAEDDADLDVEAERRREEKGKGVADVSAQVVARFRLSHTGRDVKLDVGKEETVRSIIRRLNEKLKHRPNSRVQRIRIVFFGKILQTNASLTAQGWQPGQVLNAFVYESSS